MSGDKPQRTSGLDGTLLRRALGDPSLGAAELRLLLCLAVGAGDSPERCAGATGLDSDTIDRAWQRLDAHGYLPRGESARPADKDRRRSTARAGHARLHSGLLGLGRPSRSAEPPQHPAAEAVARDRRARPLATAMASALASVGSPSDRGGADDCDRFRLWIRTILPPEDAALLLSGSNLSDGAFRRLATRYAAATDEGALGSLLEEAQATVDRAKAAIG